MIGEYISEENTKLDIGHLVPGMYFLRVANNESQQSGSFIKLKWLQINEWLSPAFIGAF